MLDDTICLWRAWRRHPSAYNLAQLVRHVGNKVIEWPLAAFVYPVVGFLGWHLAYYFRDHTWLFVFSVALPTVALGLTILVGGIVTQQLIQDLAPFLPKPTDLRRRTLADRFWGIFRSQTYWLLATRAAWRVLWSLARAGRYEPAKTDRVVRRRVCDKFVGPEI